MVTSLITEKGIISTVEARKATATVAVRTITIEKGERVIALPIILVSITTTGRTVRREVATAIVRSVLMGTVRITMKEANSVLLTTRVSITTTEDVRSVLMATARIITTMRGVNSARIVRASTTADSRVVNSVPIVRVSITVDSKAGMVVRKEDTVRVQPTTIRMRNTA